MVVVAPVASTISRGAGVEDWVDSELSHRKLEMEIIIFK